MNEHKRNHASHNETPSPSERRGLYEPSFEHDACGVGLICRMSGAASHEIVDQGLQILANLDHRGARGSDPNTGDGAGILVQVPHKFMRGVSRDAGFELPDPGDYAVGMLFMPRSESVRAVCRAEFDEVVVAKGQSVIAWRRVETVHVSLGATARATEPAVWQVFVRRGKETPAGSDFERALLVIRRIAEHRLVTRFSTAPESFYVASLSSRTIVYKGMLTTDQLREYYPDLSDPSFKSALALVHSRFSTNTLPQWRLAQPFRYTCHNGEINTVRGNVNWMRAREPLLESDLFGDDVSELLPILRCSGSDSQVLDNAVEFLALGGRSLPKTMMTLIPEAWERDLEMQPDRRAFYEYTSCLMEAWDGPAVVPFTDGRFVGAVLDRNGLRPGRYVLTNDGLVMMASEAGVLDIDSARISKKGRLRPGRMLLVDLEEQRLITDYEIKQRVSAGNPYRQWVKQNLKHLDKLTPTQKLGLQSGEELDIPTSQLVFGYTLEDSRTLIGPMSATGKPPIMSMGNDTPLAVLSDRPRLLYDYFKQLFAQVTNPPLDAIREELVTSLGTNLGARRNLLSESPEHARQIRCDRPVLTASDISVIRGINEPGLKSCTISTLWDMAVAESKTQNGAGSRLEHALNDICDRASAAIDNGCTLLILSDRKHSAERAPIPALLSTSAVHHHLIRTGRRGACSIVVESGEPREVHHFCTLLGFGASAVHPYLAFETAADKDKYAAAICAGVLKVMSKMGISTLQSYCGAQIFEAVGLAPDMVERYFTGVTSRIGGIGLDIVAEEARRRHAAAYGRDRREGDSTVEPDVGGMYQWRVNGERHVFNPTTISKLQHAVRSRSDIDYAAYAEDVNRQNGQVATIRGLLKFKPGGHGPIPLEEVEPWTSIVRRFKTGAMSYGSISQEAHETLAIAMNQIGGKSNTGEGGEPSDRYSRNSSRRSRIKQVASGRFGVTIDYLTSADEIQIKMAQGAKPGEGGQLPGAKVLPWIAETRNSTPYVGLISPPPHHDIYSIEDLAQLIFDLKNANPAARVSVKLVSVVGVGTISAGVAKAKADVVLISGHDGGTGAAPATSVMHTGLPWELGLSETHQTLVQKGLRRRIKIECDGQLKTGRDVAVAALLGADEFGFATAPLVAMGCVMMRKCHLNTCPVGIATQDPTLRQKFAGKPEHVVNYFYYVASELREIMASLGFRSLDEMVGRVDCLEPRTNIDHWKAKHLDLTPILVAPTVPGMLADFDTEGHGINLDGIADNALIEAAESAIAGEGPVRIETVVTNRDRAFGTRLSHEISRRRGQNTLRDDTITIDAEGSVGQSCGAFLAKGVTIRITGEVNDYFGKGLSGGRIIVSPPKDATFIPNMNIIVGNVALYGATSGEVFVRGQAGERFAVRNSGASAVVEGIGDHGCEYMTGGRVVILGPTGRNFAAGMSGGIAYVMDGTDEFAGGRCNGEMVDILAVTQPEDLSELFELVERHLAFTDSDVARWVIDNWAVARHHFVKVYPREYRLALERIADEQGAIGSDNHAAA